MRDKDGRPLSEDSRRGEDKRDNRKEPLSRDAKRGEAKRNDRRMPEHIRKGVGFDGRVPGSENRRDLYNPTGKDPSDMTPEERQDYRQRQIAKGRDDVLFPNGDPRLVDRLIIRNQIQNDDAHKKAYLDVTTDFFKDNLENKAEYEQKMDGIRQKAMKAAEEAREENKDKPFVDRLYATLDATKDYRKEMRDTRESYEDSLDDRAYEFGNDLGEADKDSFQDRENRRANYFKKIYGDDFYEQNQPDGDRRDPARRQAGSSFQSIVKQQENNIQNNADNKGMSGHGRDGAEADVER